MFIQHWEINWNSGVSHPKSCSQYRQSLSCKGDIVTGKIWSSHFPQSMIKALRQKEGLPQVTLLHAYELCIPDSTHGIHFLSTQWTHYGYIHTWLQQGIAQWINRVRDGVPGWGLYTTPPVDRDTASDCRFLNPGHLKPFQLASCIPWGWVLRRKWRKYSPCVLDPVLGTVEAL